MDSPQRLTLGRRLALGFGLILLLMVSITLIGIQKVNFIDRSLEQVTDVNAVKQRYAINFRGRRARPRHCAARCGAEHRSGPAQRHAERN